MTIAIAGHGRTESNRCACPRSVIVADSLGCGVGGTGLEECCPAHKLNP